MEKQLKSRDAILEFILAGRAKFSLKSLKTGEHYTFWITNESPGDHDYYFVKTGTGVLLGRLGFFNGGALSFRHAIGELKLTPNEYNLSEQAIAFGWFIRHMDSPQVEFYHAGRCGKCGRTLTDPVSIDRGIGPECAQVLSSRQSLFSIGY